jgi:signal transduction histidine kinase/DNA-binding response OmpR family regulator
VTINEENTSASVLLVDDVPANLVALEAALSPLHIETVLARSGLEALDLIKQRSFAVALVDVQMPGMDGFELTERMRETKYGRELPVIYVTAHGDPQHVQRGYATGAADYLTKPLDPQIVRARVKAFADLYEQREGVRRGQLALRTTERDAAVRRLVAFERIASAALETTDLKALLAELLDAFIDAADAADSAILYLKDGDFLRVAASTGLKESDPEEFRVRIGRGFAGLVASERRPLEVSDDAIERLVQSPALRNSHPRALYGVPLLHEGQLVGVAHIGSTTDGRFSAEERKLFSAAAERAAVAIARQLELSQQQEIFNEVPAYIAILSADSLEYLFVNPSLRDLFGRRLVGSSVGQHGFGDEVRSAIERCRVSGGPEWIEELSLSGREKPRYLRLSVQQLHDARGNLDRFLLFGTDVTEQVQARLQVEAVMVERAELWWRERRAREVAELASTTKDEFLATVSHELRTPLTSILGWSSLLRVRPGTDIDRAVNVIERNARALARIVEDVLDFSRIAKGKMRLAIRAIDLSDVIRMALDAVRPAADAKGIEINIDLCEPCPLNADPGRLQQVIWNLLSNAVKYTGPTGRVTVRTSHGADGVSLTVQDTGQGIDAHFLPHVFEPFRQANGATTRRHGGLGLGLAIVRQIVDAHGGKITAHSDGTGFGSTFVVLLPADNSERASSDLHSRPATDSLPPAPEERRLDGIKVLVVDDDDDGRELMARVLTTHGADVSLLPSATNAVEELQRFRPDVLVSDIAMAETDGYTLIRNVRALQPDLGGRTPALAVTAHAGKEVAERVFESGFQRYALKPLDVMELVGSVAELANRPNVRFSTEI